MTSQCNSNTLAGTRCNRQCITDTCWQHTPQIPAALLQMFPAADYRISPTHDEKYGTLYLIESKRDKAQAIDKLGDWYDADGNFIHSMASDLDIKALQEMYPHAQIYPYMHRKLGLVYLINDGRVGASNYYDRTGRLIMSIPVIPTQNMSAAQREWLADTK